MILASLALATLLSVPQQSTFTIYSTQSFDNAAISKAYEKWDKIATVKNFPIVIVSENDGAFSSSVMERVAPGYQCKDLSKNPKSSAVCWNKNGNGVMLLSNYIYQTIEHEAVHVAQLATIGKNIELSPCWFIEGQATFLSGNNSYGSTARFILKQIKYKFNLFSSSQWQLLIKERELRDEKCSSDGYNFSVGHIVVEKLYKDYGFDKVAQFMVTMGGKPWKDAFKEVFEISSDDWYSVVVGPYLEKLNV